MLAELFNKHGTDKESVHHYAAIYEWLLADRRMEPLRILEVGVASGASLRAWEEYFPNAEIVGVDKNPKAKLAVVSRSKIVIGDATQLATLRDLGLFDVVIDDGSHLPRDQSAVFSLLWPRTRIVYILEDVGVGGGRNRFNILGWLNERFRREIDSWRTPAPPMCWTIIAKELVAFRRITQ